MMKLPIRLMRVLAILAFPIISLGFRGAAEAEEIATRTVYYRPAEVIVDHLRAIFPAQEVTLSGLQNQIIIRARDQATVQQVQDLIDQLDKRPHQFRISLRQQGDRSSHDEGVGLGGTLTQHSDTQRSGNVTITTRHSTSNTLGQNQQTVTVLEDNAVAIQQGQMRPIRDVWIGRDGAATSTSYQQVGDALVVTPRLVAEGQVQLSVRASHSRENETNRERLDQLELVTQRIVSFGEWTELGAVSQDQSNRRQGLIHYSTRQERTLGSYEIKVDLID